MQYFLNRNQDILRRSLEEVYFGNEMKKKRSVCMSPLCHRPERLDNVTSKTCPVHRWLSWVMLRSLVTNAKSIWRDIFVTLFENWLRLTFIYIYKYMQILSWQARCTKKGLSFQFFMRQTKRFPDRSNTLWSRCPLFL